MKTHDIKIELIDIQLLLNDKNIELIKDESLDIVARTKFQAHNDVIIEAIEQLKQKL